jgi:hypothetical protein
MNSGCASRYDRHPPPADAPVVLESYVTIVQIDGSPPDDPYKAKLKAGPHTIIADYLTYTGTWRCTLMFDAKPGSLYEILDRSNPQPIVLVRRERFNFFISNRYDAVLPEECIRVSRDGTNTSD